MLSKQNGGEDLNMAQSHLTTERKRTCKWLVNYRVALQTVRKIPFRDKERKCAKKSCNKSKSHFVVRLWRTKVPKNVTCYFPCEENFCIFISVILPFQGIGSCYCCFGTMTGKNVEHTLSTYERDMYTIEGETERTVWILNVVTIEVERNVFAHFNIFTLSLTGEGTAKEWEKNRWMKVFTFLMFYFPTILSWKMGREEICR